MKKISSVLVSSALWLTANVLFAHADLSKSNPGDGSLLNDAPDAIELDFTENVRLLRFSISGGDDQAVKTEFSPSSAEQNHFSVTLPPLEEDSYTVNWAIMGGDGHLVEKSFGFTVDPDAEQRTGAVTPSETEAAPAAHSH
jgi:methionine-rich copper-binding protein CopC